MNVPMISESTLTKRGSYMETETGTTDDLTLGLHVPVPPQTPTSKGFLAVIIGMARTARENKALALWQFVRYAVSATYFWIGGTFLFGGTKVDVEPTYHLIENIETSIRVHGAILFILAIWVAVKPAFKTQTEYGLLFTFFYSLLSTMLICGGWVLHKPDFSAPAWYLLMSALSFILIATASLTIKVTATRSGGSRA